MSEKSTALAKPNAVGPLALDQVGAMFGSTFPASERAKVVKYMQGKVEALDTMIGKRIPIAHVIAHVVQIPDKETGELIDNIRTVLVTPDGKAYGAVSHGVVKSLQLIAQFYGPPPWDPARVVEVEQLKTGNNRRTYALNQIE